MLDMYMLDTDMEMLDMDMLDIDMLDMDMLDMDMEMLDMDMLDIDMLDMDGGFGRRWCALRQSPTRKVLQRPFLLSPTSAFAHSFLTLVGSCEENFWLILYRIFLG